MFKILRVNLSSLTCIFEKVPGRYVGLGGRALAAVIMAEEVEPARPAAGSDNKLVLAPGLLAGTGCAEVDRLSLAWKSPVAEGLMIADSGGSAAELLGRMNLLAVIIEGRGEQGRLQKLELTHKSAHLMPTTMAGFSNYDVLKEIRQRYGDRCGFISLGRAGEIGLVAASLAVSDNQPDRLRQAGRAGAGSVMGSKGLKAIIISPDGPAASWLADPEAFKASAEILVEALGGSAVREGGGQVGCGKCLIGCGGDRLSLKGKSKKQTAWYKARWSVGPDDDLGDLIDQYHHLCDDVGIDAFYTGAAGSYLMEKGTIASGDVSALLRQVAAIGRGSVFDEILAAGRPGLGRVSQELKKGSDLMAAALADSLGLCRYAVGVARNNPAALAAITNMVRAKYGWASEQLDFNVLVRRTIEAENHFSLRSGGGH